MIGIVGGVGPYAGLDLMKKLFDETHAGADQDHVDAMLLSLPSRLVDRTEYLEGRVKENPAYALADVLSALEEAGARVAGIPCNTAHADQIYKVIGQELKRRNCSIHLLHMISETLAFMETHYPELKRIGVLSTTGTYKSRVYVNALEKKGFEVLIPDPEMQESLIHPAIYDPQYGIKSNAAPVQPRAMENLKRGFDSLEKEGAEAVILGCTEIPLAFPDSRIGEMLAIDPTRVLARALIQHCFPHKLKPLQ